MNSKFGSLTRRCLGIQISEEAELKKFRAVRKGSSKRRCYCQKPTVEFICV
jgi:hypothetical protein